MRKKKDVSLLGKKLNSRELKKVKGGVQYQYTCCRMRKSDEAHYFFTTESSSVKDAWQNVWNGNSDWVAWCITSEIRQEEPTFQYC